MSKLIIGIAIDVHRHLGPGLLESAYEDCLCFELEQAGIVFARQVPVPILYRGVRIECGYRPDIVASQEAIVAIKAVERLLPNHDAQIMTYLRLTGCRVGLLKFFLTNPMPRRG